MLSLQHHLVVLCKGAPLWPLTFFLVFDPGPSGPSFDTCIADIVLVWLIFTKISSWLGDKNYNYLQIFSSLCLMIDELTPLGGGELNEEQTRLKWLHKVHLFRPVVEHILRLETASQTMFGTHSKDFICKAKYIYVHIKMQYQRMASIKDSFIYFWFVFILTKMNGFFNYTLWFINAKCGTASLCYKKDIIVFTIFCTDEHLFRPCSQLYR